MPHAAVATVTLTRFSELFADDLPGMSTPTSQNLLNGPLFHRHPHGNVKQTDLSHTYYLVCVYSFMISINTESKSHREKEQKAIRLGI